MTGDDVRLIIACLVGSGGMAAVVVKVLDWITTRSRVKAEAAESAARTEDIEIDTQGKLINQVNELVNRVNRQDAEIDRLKTKVSEQAEQIAALQHRNRDLAATMRAAVAELLAWIRKALAVMTSDQQANVGPPPDYQHLVHPKEG